MNNKIVLAICKPYPYIGFMTIAIDHLTAEEQKELYTQLAYRLKEVPGARQFTTDEYAFWRDIGEIVKGPDQLPLAQFVEAFGKTKFDSCRKHVNRVLKDAVPQTIRQSHKDAIKQRMLRCLANYLRLRDIPATAKTMLNNIDKLEAAVDYEFPGYIAARLLHKIVRVANL